MNEGVQGLGVMEVAHGSVFTQVSLAHGASLSSLFKGVMQVFSQACGCDAFACVDGSGELD